MPPFMAHFAAVATAGIAIYSFFQAFSGSEDDDKHSNSDSASPPQTTSTTSPSYSWSPPDSRGQTNTRTPATSASYHDLYHSSHSSTVGYGANVHRTSLSSHHVGRSSQTPSASTREPASYHQLPTDSRVAEATATTQTRHLTSDYDGYGYRLSVASSNTRESRETSTSTRAHVPRPPQVTTTSASRSTVSTIATADYPDGSRRPRLAAPYSAEFTLTDPASSPTRASYQRTSSPDATRFGYPDFSPTHTRTLSSSSGSDYLGTSPSTRVALRPPSPQPDALYGTEFEAAENAQDMKTARELRERARRCKSKMHHARDLAKRAHRSGDYNTEQNHRQDAIAFESEMKSLDKRAAKIIFKEKNKAHKEGTVDLHGLYVPEALEYAKKELEFAKYRNDDKICFITGKGLHSDGGLPKLRPRLAELCDERGLTYSLDPMNAGKLIVQLY